jgi:DNA invertase Pin-like site-specific DNA recombinase
MDVYPVPAAVMQARVQLIIDQTDKAPPATINNDVADVIEVQATKGVDLFLHQQGLDTSTPSGRAMFQMLGVFAEFERSMIRERVMAGLSRAKADGTQLGRRRLEDSDADKVAAIVAARAEGTGIRRIARELGVGVGTVLRLFSSVPNFQWNAMVRRHNVER